ncbi:MAG TPA: antibiotic biosynthesis monooxygenase family protein [Chloroflexota bacterium]|nr:antibiotic biosynthesis monooxygenase family protein [Chloroflexota bacterium]HZU07664.1 antibiotic biosynthesis monooxygenase family protein [Chloroflexota bacterium]
MFARLVVVKCEPGKEETFIQRARLGLRFYLEQPGCKAVHLLQSRVDPTQLIALSIWEREIDLLAAREKPEYQEYMAGLAETYAEPQSVGEWDVLEL